MTSADPFTEFKANQKVGWGLFAPLEAFTTAPAAKLVEFADIKPKELVLDCGCGTGVVALTAARKGAHVKALDLAPALLERAKANAALSRLEVDFKEGDVEALPYSDNTFDVVVSQFGHMFAPRPQIAAKEMLRVLKPSGRIAFSTWPKDAYVGQMFGLVSKYLPPPNGVPPVTNWGEPALIAEYLGGSVRDMHFDRGLMAVPSLTPQIARDMFERTAAPLIKLVGDLKDNPERLNEFRSSLENLIARYTKDNVLHQYFLLSRAFKI